MYNADTNNHLISLGIQLSRGHPVLQNAAFLKEMQEKIKGLKVSVDTEKGVKEVSIIYVSISFICSIYNVF